MFSDIKDFATGLISGILLTVAVFLAYQWHAAQTPAVLSGAAAPIAGEATAAVPCKSIQVYPQQAKAKLKLPKPVQADPAQHVTAATTLAASSHPETVTAVTNTDTGATALYTRIDPLPWFARSRHGEIALATGLSGGKQDTQLEVEQDIYQIKALRLGVTGQVETGGRAFLGIRAALDW